METVTMQVAVSKANIPLMKNETIGQFTSKLRDAGSVFLKRKLNLGDKDSSYMVEAMSNKAVFDVFRQKPDNGQRIKFYAVGYARKSDGVFEFTAPTEVRRITTFEPTGTKGTAQTPLVKAKEQKGSDDLAIADSAFKQRPTLKASEQEVKKGEVFGAGNWSVVE